MNTPPFISEEFSLSEGGHFDEALKKLGLYKSQFKLAIVGVCLTWLPLAIITAIEGTLFSGSQMPFLKDIAMHARLLIAFPMLIMIKTVIDDKVAIIIRYLTKALMSSEEQQLILSNALQKAKKLTSSAYTEYILLFTVIAITTSFILGDVFSGFKSGTASWMAFTHDRKQVLSVAGYWAVIISIPLFQFFLLRWLWRYFVWVLLLFRLSKANLNLFATHADRAGGLGIIILAQRSFNLIFVAGSCVISGQFVAQLLELPDTFNSVRSVVFAYIIISLIFINIPLLFFMEKLFKMKNDELLYHSYFAVTLSRKFESEWIAVRFDEKRAGENEVNPSMVHDYSGIFDSLQKLRPVPITLQDIVGMGITLFIPFVPILFIHFSVAELLQKIAGMLM